NFGLEFHFTASQTGQWNGLHDTGSFSVAPTFVVVEEEKAVFDDRAPQTAAEIITNQLRTVHATAIVEKVVCRRRRIAVVFIQVAVESVRATFGDEPDLRAGRATLSGVGVDSRHAEFFNGVRADANNRTESRAVLLIVGVESIDCQVGLIAPATGDITGRGDGWLQAQQVAYVARV